MKYSVRISWVLIFRCVRVRHTDLVFCLKWIWGKSSGWLSEKYEKSKVCVISSEVQNNKSLVFRFAWLEEAMWGNRRWSLLCLAIKKRFRKDSRCQQHQWVLVFPTWDIVSQCCMHEVRPLLWPDFDFLAKGDCEKFEDRVESVSQAIISHTLRFWLHTSCLFVFQGYTKALRLVSVKNAFSLVDMPGYGHNMPPGFVEIVENYLKSRQQ